MTLEYIQKTTEFQIFDRKSAKIDAKGLAVVLIAFANADGGTVALGVEDNGELTGVDGMQNHLNDLLRASYDYCAPSIPTTPEYMEVTDSKGNPNHIILLRVTASMKVHANQVDEVYYRVGDKSKKLTSSNGCNWCMPRANASMRMPQCMTQRKRTWTRA